MKILLNVHELYHFWRILDEKRAAKYVIRHYSAGQPKKQCISAMF